MHGPKEGSYSSPRPTASIGGVEEGAAGGVAGAADAEAAATATAAAGVAGTAAGVVDATGSGAAAAGTAAVSGEAAVGGASDAAYAFVARVSRRYAMQRQSRSLGDELWRSEQCQNETHFVASDGRRTSINAGTCQACSRRALVSYRPLRHASFRAALETTCVCKPS